MPFWKNPGTASKSARTEGAEVWYSLAVGATGLGVRPGAAKSRFPDFPL